MTKHAPTPGPWGVRFSRNLTAITTPKGEMQLSLHGVYDGLRPLSVSRQDWEANARLLAASWDLLRALKGVKSHNAALKPQFRLSESLMRQVDAAIALADGGQS